GGARHLLEQAWRKEMAEGVDVAHGSSTPVNYLSAARSRVSGNPAPPDRGSYFWVPAFAGTSGTESFGPMSSVFVVGTPSSSEKAGPRASRRALDHRRRAQFGDFSLVIAELGENGIGVLAERRRRQGALVAAAVDKHGAMNGGDLAFARMALPVERAQ